MLPPPTKFALKKNNNVLYLKNEQVLNLNKITQLYTDYAI